MSIIQGHLVLVNRFGGFSVKQFYIVDSSMLPEVVGKVIAARALLQNGEVKQVEPIINTRIMFFYPTQKWHRVKRSSR